MIKIDDREFTSEEAQDYILKLENEVRKLNAIIDILKDEDEDAYCTFSLDDEGFFDDSDKDEYYE